MNELLEVRDPAYVVLFDDGLARAKKKDTSMNILVLYSSPVVVVVVTVPLVVELTPVAVRLIVEAVELPMKDHRQLRMHLNIYFSQTSHGLHVDLSMQMIAIGIEASLLIVY